MQFGTTPYGHIAEIIFVGDPMCSWCYGFGSELTKLRNTLQEVPFSMLMGGLRDGDLFDADKLQKHLGYWDAVAQETGLPFDATALSQPGFNYTTEPACRAVVAMKSVDESKVYALYSALQQAFYAEGRDITRAEVIADVVMALGVDIAMFKCAFEKEATVIATTIEKQKARTYGVSSFPTLIIIDKQGHMSQIRGYKKYEALMALIKK